MSIVRNSLIIILTFFVTTSAYAGWDQECVNTCIRTNHACNYCDYQCWREDVAKQEYETGDNYRCPFPEYY